MLFFNFRGFLFYCSSKREENRFIILFTCIIVRKYIADCPQGFYGKNCSTECSLNCHVFSDCDRSTGQCKRGCKQGWTGNTCDQSK